MTKARAAGVVAVLAAAPLALLAGPVPAQAQPPAQTKDGSYEAPLDRQLNGSGARGTVLLELRGTRLRVRMSVTGLAPNVPHALHIHGAASGAGFSCPTAEQQRGLDKDGNGTVSTTEAASFYGPVHVALTTTGGTGRDSGLALDRFPRADAKGNLRYERVIALDPATAANLANLHVVQHGVDTNRNGRYDGPTRSDLDRDLPAEATDPAVCGAVERSQVQGTPVGGVETGGGDGAAGALPLYVVGGALVGAAAVVGLRRRTPSGWGER